jgi:hypothetical protein
VVKSQIVVPELPREAPSLFDEQIDTDGERGDRRSTEASSWSARREPFDQTNALETTVTSGDSAMRT